jgi:fructosamine-3-kinase
VTLTSPLIEQLTGWTPVRLEPVEGGSICQCYRAIGPAGKRAFVKTHETDHPGLFDAEARSLRWLASAAAAHVPDVLAVDDYGIALSYIDEEAPSPARAEQFGHDLAALHRAGAARFGAPWPGFAGPLPMPNDAADDWPTFLARKRIEPLLRHAMASGNLADATSVERVISRMEWLVDGSEPPSRCHGDLWSGNVMFTGTSAAVVDPSAYGGHREADLAMLCLFSAPYLNRILAGYHDAYPLLDGWRERLGVHQLVPLLAHAALFGGQFGQQVTAMARRYA